MNGPPKDGNSLTSDHSEDHVHCMNSLCRQRGIQMVALRDLKLTDLEPVVHLFKYRMKVSVGYILIKGPYTNYVDKQGHTVSVHGSKSIL